ncbi:MAG TPA: hypothetical protein EYP36_08915 [Calditrichaeota bacterium]|nr:hypothetical protein [Calditrichota bacterium]
MEDDGGDDPVPVEYSFNGIKYKTTIHSGDDEMGETAVWRSSSKDAIHTTGKFEFVVKWK